MTTAIMPTWDQICADPNLRDLPYKIEQDRYGRIVMSPAMVGHGWHQAQIAKSLEALLPGWAASVECGIDTPEGVKVPDVVAMPLDRLRRHRDSTHMAEAPEICVEVLSSGNTPEEMDEKRRLYAGQGCREFWTCSREGNMAFFDASSGEKLSQSVICPDFPQSFRLD